MKSSLTLKGIKVAQKIITLGNERKILTFGTESTMTKAMASGITVHILSI